MSRSSSSVSIEIVPDSPHSASGWPSPHTPAYPGSSAGGPANNVENQGTGASGSAALPPPVASDSFSGSPAQQSFEAHSAVESGHSSQHNTLASDSGGGGSAGAKQNSLGVRERSSFSSGAESVASAGAEANDAASAGSARRHVPTGSPDHYSGFADDTVLRERRAPKSAISWGPVEDACKPSRSSSGSRSVDSSRADKSEGERQQNLNKGQGGGTPPARGSFIGQTAISRDHGSQAEEQSLFRGGNHVVRLSRVANSDIRELLPSHARCVVRWSSVWRFFLLTIVLRLCAAVGILLLGGITFSRIRACTRCTSEFCFQGENAFTGRKGYAWAHDMLRTFEWQLFLPSLFIGLAVLANCFTTLAVLRRGTKQTVVREETATTLCSLLCTFALAALVTPLLLVWRGFCNFSRFDWLTLFSDIALRPTQAAAALCDLRYLVLFTAIAAALAVGSELVLFFRSTRDFWKTTLALGYLKFAVGAVVFFLAVLISEDTTQYHDAVRDTHNAFLLQAAAEEQDKLELEGVKVSIEAMMAYLLQNRTPIVALPNSVAAQYTLFYQTTMSALYIMGLLDIVCGLFACASAWSKSPMLASLNVLVNFVFVVVNVVAVGGLIFGASALKFACNYREYPVPQAPYDKFFADLVCQIRPDFLVAWGALAVLVILFLVDFFVSAWAFFQQHCRRRPRAPS